MINYKLLHDRGIDVVNRIIYINTDIDCETSFNVQTGLKYMEGDKPIIININSFGGSAVDGFCIYEILKRHKCSPIITFNTGCAMSAGLIIYMAGSKRLSLDHAEFLYHGPKNYGESDGIDHRGLSQSAKELKDMKLTMAQIMADGSNKPKSFWSTKAANDFTFKKKKAVELGIVTEE